jgi:hypothetical protein
MKFKYIVFLKCENNSKIVIDRNECDFLKEC